MNNLTLIASRIYCAKVIANSKVESFTGEKGYNVEELAKNSVCEAIILLKNLHEEPKPQQPKKLLWWAANDGCYYSKGGEFLIQKIGEQYHLSNEKKSLKTESRYGLAIEPTMDACKELAEFIRTK